MRYSIEEAAMILGVSVRTLYRRIKAGDILTEKDERDERRRWVILEEVADKGSQMAATVLALPEVEGLIKAATAPLEKEIRSLRCELREERKAHEKTIASLAREYGQLETRVALLTAPGGQPSWVQRLREWWGRRG